MKCLKCQNDTFDKRTIFVKMANAGARRHPDEDKFEVLRCRKCHLTQWYNYYIASAKERPEIRPGKSLYSMPAAKDFKCCNCRSTHSLSEIGAPIDEGCSMHGEIFLRICSDCGLAELYNIILVHNSDRYRAEIRMKERADMASSYRCPMCSSVKVGRSGQIVFDKDEKRPRYLPVPSEPFLFIACDRCKYMMTFSGNV